jgi:hypothetical protein
VDAVLEQAKGPYGERRFYPPGKHPALFREYDQIEKLEELREITGEDGELIDEAVAYHRDRVAMFEEGESVSKAEYLAVRG